MSRDPEILKLEAEIAANKAKIAQLEERNKRKGRSLAIKELSEMTDAEKIEAYNALYTSALNYVDSAEENGYANDDDQHYAWEEFISIVARDKKEFWKYYNTVINN